MTDQPEFRKDYAYLLLQQIMPLNSHSITQSNTPSTENPTYTYAKLSLVVIAPQNLESAPMISTLKKVDTPTPPVSKEYVLGVK